ncbi:Hypothetical predicted protein [Olea europaea subsp. europaea]|uniref:Uncharacterized protein n=1 Tax=Olea europaea subsp. europaea TaxID=158383 RepID=A0A8S0SV56_OLEEU|nr:Hypothetical predicted protein [Olea europaea subsp. europaea]
MASMSKKNKRRREMCNDSAKLDIDVQTPKRKSLRFVELEVIEECIIKKSIPKFRCQKS